jgi:hypothetical protein
MKRKALPGQATYQIIEGKSFDLSSMHGGDHRIFMVTVLAKSGNIVKDRMTQQEAKNFMDLMEAKHPKACMIKAVMEEFK